MGKQLAQADVEISPTPETHGATSEFATREHAALPGEIERSAVESIRHARQWWWEKASSYAF